MILINKNSTTRNILTLSEKTTIENAVYLFEVTNTSTNDVKCFIAEDVGTNKERCNEFDFIENSTEDLLNGTFSLELAGQYTYKVYEQTSSTNLDPESAINEIDNGILKVVDTQTTNLQYSGASTQSIVYNG